MKVKNEKGFIRFELERHDLHFLLLNFADKFLDNEPAISALKKYRESLEPEDYSLVLNYLGVNQISIWLDFDDALKLSDDLVEELFPNVPEKPKVKLARICVDCHACYISERKGHHCA